MVGRRSKEAEILLSRLHLDNNSYYCFSTDLPREVKLKYRMVSRDHALDRMDTRESWPYPSWLDNNIYDVREVVNATEAEMEKRGIDPFEWRHDYWTYEDEYDEDE